MVACTLVSQMTGIGTSSICTYVQPSEASSANSSRKMRAMSAIYSRAFAYGPPANTLSPTNQCASDGAGSITLGVALVAVLRNLKSPAAMLPERRRRETTFGTGVARRVLPSA